MAIPYLACMAVVASVYHLPPRVLPAIHVVEGGEVGTVHRNADGTDDFGVMQINTRWLPTLARLARMSPPAVAARLVADPCFNIAAAGVVMRTYLNERHGDLMGAIGDYHSHTPTFNAAYQVVVRAAAYRLFVQPPSRQLPR